MSVAHTTRIQCRFKRWSRIDQWSFKPYGYEQVDHELALFQIWIKINRFDHFLLQIHKEMSLPIRKSTRKDISRQVLNANKLSLLR